MLQQNKAILKEIVYPPSFSFIPILSLCKSLTKKDCKRLSCPKRIVATAVGSGSCKCFMDIFCLQDIFRLVTLSQAFLDDIGFVAPQYARPSMLALYYNFMTRQALSFLAHICFCFGGCILIITLVWCVRFEFEFVFAQFYAFVKIFVCYCAGMLTEETFNTRIPTVAYMEFLTFLHLVIKLEFYEGYEDGSPRLYCRQHCVNVAETQIELYHGSSA